MAILPMASLASIGNDPPPNILDSFFNFPGSHIGNESRLVLFKEENFRGLGSRIKFLFSKKPDGFLIPDPYYVYWISRYIPSSHQPPLSSSRLK
ncbi:MAG: hypothetical protein V3S64_09465 [bacterium]